MKRRIKVLVVDDEPDMRFFLCNLLGGCGYVTIHAENRRDGLRKAKRERPALIILDVMMANEDGLQLYRDLKEDRRLRSIPVIMVSSVGKKAFLQYQKSYCTLPGAAPVAPGAYLKKPLNAEELIGWVLTLTSVAPAASPPMI
jgi:two-component system, OmpR family, phosphate regulon response regulator PhoB